MAKPSPVDIRHETPVALSPRVRRITAGNIGPMTGQGTNTYLIGREQVAVVDPGPAMAEHVDAILDACGDRLKWILATHSHPDHSPAAAALASATGAEVLGNQLADNDGYQDETFAPLRGFADDEQLVTAEFTLRAIHTPGHVDNHVCFLLEEEGLLLTGDHIMQGSTVVIIPPHGDMQDYMASLQRLLNYPLQALAPGHGVLIDDPVNEIDRLLAHRLGREAKVVEVLCAEGRSALPALTPLVYDDVDPSLYPIAQCSLLAHLIKLEKEKRVHREGEDWVFFGG